MAVEHTIYCDGCSSILVAASSVGKARKEGRESGLVHRIGDKDYCTECYERMTKRADIKTEE